ncbi:hypothetical protein MBCUT_09800 [Methanobrevibacter cuticularis]|uniref:DUF356 domain-containing protein n=1 Tax=Methanobrevibacter cuticularis TaxID=47311 RepID=A0A166E3N6_9EURY|nr:DUF356 domain-containing protein [Methanobrevibacter cuticularis]KZX16244.1 hypothetical protein MBCUT_09800 [Methanobrevibacter cuticularis]
MALILIRGDNNSKLLNAIADIERHAKLNLIAKPQKIDSNFADKIVESILNSPLRTKSKVATSFFIKEDITLAIMQIKKIHPPAHVVVVSDEYEDYEKLREVLNDAPIFGGYYSNKAKTTELKDYKHDNLSRNKKRNFS